MIQWVPFASPSCIRIWTAAAAAICALAALFFSLQALSSGHGAVFAAVAGAALIAAVASRSVSRVDIVRRVRDLGVTGAVLLLPSLLVTLPYLAVQREMQLAAFPGGCVDVGRVGGQLSGVADPRPRVHPALR